MSKVICVDTSGIFFPCVFVEERLLQDKLDKQTDQFIMSAHVMYYNTILSCLKKIGVDKDDVIVMATEGHSWRKDYLASYKAQRADDREKHKLINWDKQFELLNKLHNQLDEATNWHFVRDWNLAEADDVCAVTVRYFKDKEVVVVTGDKDLYQLDYYDNCKIFTVNKKIKGTKGCYETTITNPLKIIADKTRLGDRSDNLIPLSTDTDEDRELRYMLVNLLELPDYVENAIKEKLSNLPKKELNLNLLPPFKNAKEKFLQIYEKDNVITYEQCEKLMEKRKARKKK